MPRKGPAGVKIHHYRDRRNHRTRSPVLAYPALRRLLDAPDGRELLAIEPSALKSRQHAVVQNVTVEQTLEQAQAGALARSVVVPLLAIGFVSPPVVHRRIPKPRASVLILIGSAQLSIPLTEG